MYKFLFAYAGRAIGESDNKGTLRGKNRGEKDIQLSGTLCECSVFSFDALYDIRLPDSQQRGLRFSRSFKSRQSVNRQVRGTCDIQGNDLCDAEALTPEATIREPSSIPPAQESLDVHTLPRFC